jgi:hypothetical protein
MALTATPYGLRPVGVSGSSPYTGGTVRQYRLTADNDVAIYTYAPVVQVAGAINGCDTTPDATTLSDNTIIGVCVGVQYTLPTLLYTLNGTTLPANCITAGYTNVLVSVVDDSNQLFMGQANGAITQAEIGLNTRPVTFTGNSITGYSTMALDATAATTNTYALRIVDIVNQNSIFGGGLSAPGDAYTDIIVRWNLGAHNYHYNTGR